MGHAVTLAIGPITLGAPVILAPMAGVTNAPFRQLCREAGMAGIPAEAPGTPVDAPAGLYVCEMITSRALVERTPETMRMLQPDPGDPVRSVQLYGVDPATIAAAVRILVDEGYADHVDLNFGCPVPKVTRKGGGGALPWKQDRFRSILRAVVQAADDVVLRAAGVGEEHLVELGCAVGLHDAADLDARARAARARRWRAGAARPGDTARPAGRTPQAPQTPRSRPGRHPR